MQANTGQTFSGRQHRRSGGRRDSISMQQKFKLNNNRPHNYPSSESSFRIFVLDYAFWVDKTMFLHFLLTVMPTSSLILRPRRFGKSTIIKMIQTFFQKVIEEKEAAINKMIFTGGEYHNKKLQPLQIFKNHPDLVEKHQGKYLVIFLDLKDVSPQSYEDFLRQMRHLISKLCKKFIYLLKIFRDNGQQTRDQYELFLKMKGSKCSDFETIKGFETFTQWLYDYNKKQIIFLVDEYDHPITHMLYNNSTKEDRQKVKQALMKMLGPILKGNQMIFKAVLIGIMDIFTSEDESSTNNLKIYSITNPSGFQYFGLTATEVENLIRKILTTFFSQQYQNDIQEETNELMARIKEWYNGYQVKDNSQKIYNPFAVMRYLYQCTETKKIIRPTDEWTGSKQDTFFIQIFTKMYQQNILLFEKIVSLVQNPKQGKLFQYLQKIELSKRKITQNISEKRLTYLLLSTGYITGELTPQQTLKAYIPNSEICNKFIKMIYSWILEQKIQKKDIFEKSQLILQNPKDLQSLVDFVLKKKQNDLRHKNQALFSCFFFALLFQNKRHYLSVQMPVEGGRIDHIFYPKEGFGSTTVIIHEYKYQDIDKTTKDSQLEAEALWQIYEKKYLSHALKQQQKVNYSSICVRSMIVQRKQSAKTLQVKMGQDQIHNIQEAKYITTEINSWRLKNSDLLKVGKEMFKKLYQQEKKKEIIKKVFDEMSLLEKIEEKFGQTQKSHPEPKYFNYDKVGVNLPVIGEQWHQPKKNILVAQFQNQFSTGFDLYNCKLHDILALKNIKVQQALLIYQGLLNAKMSQINFQEKQIEKHQYAFMKPNNLRYNEVVKTLPIERNNRGKKMKQFKKRFPNSVELYQCKLDDILKINGMNKQEAQNIYNALQEAKQKRENFYMFRKRKVEKNSSSECQSELQFQIKRR